MRKQFIIASVLILAFAIFLSWLIPGSWWILVIVIPILALGYYDMWQKKHSIMRNFPLFGRGRYVMEDLRPKIYQYFIESDIDGRPFSRTNRSVVYSRAKKENDTSPFGTQQDVYAPGYEWMNHSLGAMDITEVEGNPRILIGGKDCKQPYSASLFNISAMSFGSLSSAAIHALSKGSKIGGFYHNTGEGGVSPYHLEGGGDLVWQVGTGYFGCRAEDGGFSAELFRETASHSNVKMIELKLSQGAKPGHGGILPAKKNSKEIAAIRGVKPFTDVLSPPYHKAFKGPFGLLQFIAELRELSEGKPIGIKLCVGRQSEFITVCRAMVKTGIKPDFIAVDGGEGGTGAAPLEFSDSVGIPMSEGLAFVYDALVGHNLKDDITIIASGKIVTGFHMFRAQALGADLCSSARGMMLALGCIQALECNKNTCPTGVATQDKSLIPGLEISDKSERVANYHHETVHSFNELLAAAGLKDHTCINRSHIYKRTEIYDIKRFDQLFPYCEKGVLLTEDFPSRYKMHMDELLDNDYDPGKIKL